MFIGHDLGTGGDKAVLVDADGHIRAMAFVPYGLDHPRPDWAEQDPATYWSAVCESTRTVMERSGVDPGRVKGVGFAAQMLTQVPLDASGAPTRQAISWLDARAEAEAARIVRRLGGRQLVRFVAGAVPSAKDVVAKWAWIRDNEPDVWDRTAALTDATGYLVARSTGVVCADHTAGGGTGMIDRSKRTWSRPLLTASGLGGRDVRRRLPALRGCSEVVGGLSPVAALELGLVAGTPVVAGVGDVPAAQVGSGAVLEGQAHVCLGTSAWLCVTTSAVADLPAHGVFSLPAADPSTFATVGEMETAGECLDWFARVLFPDADESSGVAALVASAAGAPSGCDGLTFAPWLFGERAPVNDPTLRATFLGLSLQHTRAHLARAVLEGVAHNLRWLLDAVAAKGMGPSRLRVIGGGVRSPLWMQTIADVTGLAVDTLDHPQYAGARGAALLAAVGTGTIASVADVAGLSVVAETYEPTSDPALAAAHDRAHRAFLTALPAATGHARALRR
jgi:xylulokinase